MCQRLDALLAKPWVDGQGQRIVTPATVEAFESAKRIIMSGRVEGASCIDGCIYKLSCRCDRLIFQVVLTKRTMCTAMQDDMLSMYSELYIWQLCSSMLSAPISLVVSPSAALSPARSMKVVHGLAAKC